MSTAAKPEKRVRRPLLWTQDRWNRVFARVCLQRKLDNGKIICYDHNYKKEGCLEGRKGRPCLPGQQGRCVQDHDICHFCGEPGHIGRLCVKLDFSTACKRIDFELKHLREVEESAATQSSDAKNVAPAAESSSTDDTTAKTATQVAPAVALTPALRDLFKVPETVRGHEYVFVVGGRNRGKTIGYVDRFCVQTQKWEQVRMFCFC